MAHPHGSFARMHMVGAAAVVASALTIGACFQLVPDATPDGGADSGVDAVTADASDAGDAGEASSPPFGECNFRVDPSSDAGGYTYATITAAVAAAQRSSCSISPTVRVARGTYSAATGEAFPIEVRGVLVEGDDQDATTVSGVGPIDEVVSPSNEVTNLAMNLDVAGTFLVGAGAAQTSISNLSIIGSSLSGYTTEGIVCDRGNGSAAPAATPNTTIDHVTVKGLDTAVRVTWSQVGTAFSGCNALIVHSTLQDGWFGVIADGYGTDTSPVQLVSLRLGDSATDGNQLLNFHYSVTGAVLTAGGLAISDAVTGGVVRGNTFSNQDFGIWIVQHDYDPTGGFDIEDNTVGPLVSNEGVGLTGNVAVKSFVNNRVQGVSMIGQPAQYRWLGVGLALGLEGFPGAPFVAYARNNTFFGNDCGVEFRSSTDPLPGDAMHRSDFGTATDPGHNTFQCNSGWADNAPGPGGDVWMYMHASAVAPVTVPFEGNIWDHQPPTTVPSTSPATIPRGVDVFEYAVPAGDGGPLQVVGGALDTADAAVAPVTCPQNFVPGPGP